MIFNKYSKSTRQKTPTKLDKTTAGMVKIVAERAEAAQPLPQPLFLDTHKTNRLFIGVHSGNQMGDALQGLGHVLLDLAHLRVRKKMMRCTHRTLPDGQPLVRQAGGCGRYPRKFS